jgi:hypothetical protein
MPQAITELLICAFLVALFLCVAIPVVVWLAVAIKALGIIGGLLVALVLVASFYVITHK